MKNMSKISTALVAAALVWSSCLFAQTPSATGATSTSISNTDLISTYKHQAALAAIANAPIKSASDLAIYENEHLSDSPLRILSPTMKQIFVNSIRYNEKGVTSLRYDVLESLTPTEAYQILSLFGMQSLTPGMSLKSVTPLDKQIMSLSPNLTPLKGYFCEGKGTCREGKGACSDAC